jgi:hypothetical protein
MQKSSFLGGPKINYLLGTYSVIRKKLLYLHVFLNKSRRLLCGWAKLENHKNA